MIKYPSIDQFRQVIREVKSRSDYQGKDENGDPIYSHKGDYPVLTFEGTVKLHGTNAGIVKNKEGYSFQSRERELTLTQDNAQFMMSMKGKNLDPLFDPLNFEDQVVIFGEWCGGNIQKGVGITGLPKMFVIFGIQVDGKWVSLWDINYVLSSLNTQDIYLINQFPTWEMKIDFNKPEEFQNQLITLTEEVEKECPVAKYFGVSGIGEGIVWRSFEDPGLAFKVKGEKHSVSKVTKLAAVDTVMLENMNQFISLALTENRLKQGVDKLKEMGITVDQKATGDFLRWIFNDVIKEEEDTIIKNQLDIKKLNNMMSGVARNWYFNQL